MKAFVLSLSLSYYIHAHLPCWNSVVVLVVYRPSRSYSIGLQKKAVEPQKE